MVVDIQHYVYNNKGEDLYEDLSEIFRTWGDDKLIHKIHYSSPKEGEFNCRHADYINYVDLVKYMRRAKEVWFDNYAIMFQLKRILILSLLML